MKSKYILNQVGYTPNATKKLVYNGADDRFQVMRLQALGVFFHKLGGILKNEEYLAFSHS